MNTRAVAKYLGVSSSTIKRWVKLLELPLEKNELGHFTYMDEDIAVLKAYKEQQSEAILTYQEIASGKDSRKGKIFRSTEEENDMLINRIMCLEAIVHSKADEVVTYQLLQHRKEMEEMQSIITQLEERIGSLEAQAAKALSPIPPTDQLVNITPRKKKKHRLLNSVFRI